ncbi:MAG TPA: response regulator [Gemmatimonadaceae bacterium]|nr:response regulator [Gemmatimonadaceae bacterium]
MAAAFSSHFRARISRSDGERGSRPHLLIVEDNADVADAMTILFEHNGYRVSAAASIAEAVQVGVHDEPRVVLLDLSLGQGEDGLEIIRRWRECGVTVPHIIALTGHSDDDTHERCTRAGCAAVLLKPVPSAALLANVRAAT